MQQNKETHDQVSEQNQADFREVVQKLNHLSWKEGYDLIHTFCYTNTKVDVSLIKEIMRLENKEFIDLFLREYVLFDEEDKAYLETCINLNLSHHNTEYVSDLIYFANDLALNLDYQKVLALIHKQAGNENYLVLAAINYISNHIKYYYIQAIVGAFNEVIHSKDYFHSEQILASLSLYKITHQVAYLEVIVELIEVDKENLTFLSNVLEGEAYQQEYFDLSVVKSKISNLKIEKKR